ISIGGNHPPAPRRRSWLSPKLGDLAGRSNENLKAFVSPGDGSEAGSVPSPEGTLNSQCVCTAGRVERSGAGEHVGCPNPVALIPVPPLGFGLMSKMMLSGCEGSPETPPTAANPSKRRVLRVRHATM